MKNKFLSFIKDHFSIILTILILTAISVINSSRNIGLIEDGVHHFWEAVTSGNIWIGHEGFYNFPYNSRFFPSILSHLATGLAVKAGILNIGVLLYLFTMISYLSPLLFLVIIYLNLPENKKEYFDIILLSFLICVTFMIYQIWTENLITGLFLWIIFVIYYYTDFKKLSYINIFSLLIFPVAAVSSHPMVAVFIPVLLIIGIKKYINNKNLSLSAKIILIYSFILLIFAFIFNCYYILHPIFAATNEYLQGGVFYGIKMLRLCISVLLILFITVKIKNVKNSKIYNFLYIIACVNIFDDILFNIQSSDGYTYRTLGFYSVLVFMIFLIFFKNIKNTVYIKIINIVMLSLLLANSVQYTRIWDKYLSDVNRHFIANKQINILYDSKLNIYTSQPVFFQVYHYHLHPFVLLLLPETFGISGSGGYKTIVISQSQSLADFYVSNIIKRKNILKKFSINTDENFKLYFKKGKDLIDLESYKKSG